MQRRHGLRELDLSHNDFGDEGAATIGHAIGKSFLYDNFVSVVDFVLIFGFSWSVVLQL